MKNMKNEVIATLTVVEIGEKHDNICCPCCNNFSKPCGLGELNIDKIQLVRKCRYCNKLFWYWINLESALTPFGE
jgi:hypothetical protein